MDNQQTIEGIAQRGHDEGKTVRSLTISNLPAVQLENHAYIHTYVINGDILYMIAYTKGTGGVGGNAGSDIYHGMIKSLIITTPADSTSWQTYRNDTYGFSFVYPQNWMKWEYPPEIIAKYGDVVHFRSPELQQNMNKYNGYEGPLFNLRVSYWKDMNNQSAKGGSWLGEREYKNLADYFTDLQAMKKKVGEITVAGQKGYEVSIGGAGLNYGVMIETTHGIYEISFDSTWEKNNLGPTGKHILSTFKFTR